MNQTLSDAQLDTAAKAHVARNNVSYVEALQSVLIMANNPAANYSEADLGAGTLPDEATLHVAATLYAATHNVSYDRALKVLEAVRQQKAGFSEPPQLQSGMRSDSQIDAAANFYRHAHGVSYAEALSCVADTMQPLASSYSAPALPVRASATDAQIDAAAQQHVRAHGGSYSEALNCVRFEGTSAFSEANSAAVASFEGQSIEIFKVGTQTDTNGVARQFTIADIKGMAASYSPGKHEAPLTLGHPADNRPSYGWVKSLHATEDGRLMMRASQVDPAFAEGVKAGRYKKRSAQFYMPQTPNNPAPGNWYLRHVAWLGAQPPAVRGLADASFEEPTGDYAIYHAP